MKPLSFGIDLVRQAPAAAAVVAVMVLLKQVRSSKESNRFGVHNRANRVTNCIFTYFSQHQHTYCVHCTVAGRLRALTEIQYWTRSCLLIHCVHGNLCARCVSSWSYTTVHFSCTHLYPIPSAFIVRFTRAQYFISFIFCATECVYEFVQTFHLIKYLFLNQLDRIFRMSPEKCAANVSRTEAGASHVRRCFTLHRNGFFFYFSNLFTFLLLFVFVSI